MTEEELSKPAVERAAELLFAARRPGNPLDRLPADCAPGSLAQGYAIQDRLVDLLCRRLPARPVGYKIGCTNPSAQQLLGVAGPFYGRLLDRFVHASPARLDPEVSHKRVMEAEFAFRMGRDLPVAAAPYQRDQVAAAVAIAMPSLEVVDSRYGAWTGVGAAAIVADNGSAGAWVHGREIADWQAFDLARHAVSLSVDGKRIREGAGAAVMGHPLAALAWLANALATQGRQLSAGDVVSTGTCIDVHSANAGEHVVADFGTLGRVEARFAK